MNSCGGCGQPVTRRPKVKNAAKFCNPSCYGVWKAKQHAVRWGDLRTEKAQARERLVLVQPEVDALRRIARYVERPRLTRRPCRVCGASVIGVRDRPRSCGACTQERMKQQRRKARQSPSAKAGKLKYKSVRRAREAIEAEIVNPYVVFSRAGWKCQLCGIPTPNPQAPERDIRARCP